MKMAIMQPYFFPYIGYFQLVNSVNKFVFYDDVTFIKQGWINRNRVLLNGKEHLITLKLNKASSNRLINEIEITKDNEALLKTITQAYSKAPFFNEVFPLIQEVFVAMHELTRISNIAEYSVKRVAKYLNLSTIFETSSESYSYTKYLGREDRLLEICKVNNAEIYINSLGGRELYNKDYFLKEGVRLFFIKNNILIYKQHENVFVPRLSIIDVMMFNSPGEVRAMLDDFELF